MKEFSEFCIDSDSAHSAWVLAGALYKITSTLQYLFPSFITKEMIMQSEEFGYQRGRWL